MFEISICIVNQTQTKKRVEIWIWKKIKLNTAMLLIVSLWTIWELLKSINFYFLRLINSEIGSVDDVDRHLLAITDLHVVWEMSVRFHLRADDWLRWSGIVVTQERRFDLELCKDKIILIVYCSRVMKISSFWRKIRNKYHLDEKWMKQMFNLAFRDFRKRELQLSMFSEK